MLEPRRNEIFIMLRLGKGSIKKKKNLEFSRFGSTHPPTLVITENLEKKLNFYCSKMIFILIKTSLISPYVIQPVSC